MKSDGNRSRLRRIALFRFPVVTPYKGAKSKSSSTFSPRITRMTFATCRITMSSLLIAFSSRKRGHTPCSVNTRTRFENLRVEEDVTNCDILSISAREARTRKPVGTGQNYAYRLIQNPCLAAIEPGQIAIDYNFLLAQIKYLFGNRVDRNNVFAHGQASSRAICTTVELKMLKRNWGAMPMANMRRVTGIITHFSLGLSSAKATSVSTRGPLKSACIARIKTTAVKRRPKTATAVKEAAMAKEPLKIRNSPMNPFSPGSPSEENMATLIQPQRSGARCI